MRAMFCSALMHAAALSVFTVRWSATVCAQQWPTKPVRIDVPFHPDRAPTSWAGCSPSD